MQLLYRFQLQLVQNFGYYFGTCLGVRYFFPATRSNFHTWLLPGATAGFIWYVNAEWQILLGVEIFLERVPSLPTKDGEVSVLNLESYGATLTVERYFTLNTAIVANLSANTVLHEMQRKDSAQVSDLHRRDVRVALGINYHLL